MAVPDAQRSGERFKQSALYKIWQEPEVQDFIRAPWARAVEQASLIKKQAEAKTGTPIPDLADVSFGSIGIAVLPPVPGQMLPIPGLIAAVEVREGVAKVGPLFESLKNLVVQNVPVVRQPYTHQGVDVFAVAHGPFVFCGAQDGNMFLVSLGRGPMNMMLDARRQRPEDSLAALPLFRRTMKHAGDKPNSFAFLNVEEALKAYEPLLMQNLPPDAGEVLQALGLRGLQAVCLASTTKGTGSRNLVRLEAPEPRYGLMKMLALPHAKRDGIRFVPENASACGVVAVSVLEMWRELMAAISRLDGRAYGEIAEGLAKLDQELRLNLETDLLGPLGGEITAYYAFPTELGVIISVQDPVRLAGGIRTLLELGATEMAPRWRRKLAKVLTLDHRGTAVHYAPVRVEDVTLWPSYAMQDNWLVLGLNPQTVKKVLNRMADGGSSILENQDFRLVAGNLPAEAGVIRYVDLRTVVRLAYEFLTVAFQLAADERGMREMSRNLGIDWGKLPPAETVCRHLTGAGDALTTDKEGISLQSYAPVDVPLGAVGATGFMAGLALPAVQRARGEARRTACKSNLKQFGLAILMYTTDFDERMPPKLEDLFPDYVTAKQLFMCPSDHRPTAIGKGLKTSYRYVGSLPTAVGASVIIAYERRPHHRGRGRNALFYDGHVAWIPEGALRKELQKSRGLAIAALGQQPDPAALKRIEAFYSDRD